MSPRVDRRRMAAAAFKDEARADYLNRLFHEMDDASADTIAQQLAIVISEAEDLDVPCEVQIELRSAEDAFESLSILIAKMLSETERSPIAVVVSPIPTDDEDLLP
jgi:hypothetical protein